jgi:predicted ribonuclease YlaK
MGVQKLREEIHNYIDHADERFLKMVYAMSKEYKESAVVGYNVDGSPITKESLTLRVKAASQRVKSGDYITQEEVEKEIENW